MSGFESVNFVSYDASSVNYGDFLLFFLQGVNKDSYLILEKLPPE